ncbi:3-oxoacyl-[acyl-carrier-protein] reductase [Clostridium sp. BNL1100]|uniref:3-oxoacyl-[acyl-carrier-protein] reductase n=1 Tax=Clostridium sp. BNL1100 TaxID=755731 RepID=UPI00024A7D04|nr:3-oxoacyl-[acyl-carrier-protein] reductase [Clostridium sp. BNL1100]AEY67082.1 3-oxoacyl-(acyl-carrier-protein) reductase [Clostridium sp. BNL1100]
MWKLFDEGCTALVTGASRGIGRAIALELARQGVDVVINYRSNEEMAVSLKEEIEEMGRQALIIKADMQNPEEIKQMFKQIKSQFRHIDILVNNAGIIKDGYLMMMSEASFQKVIDTNLLGCFRISQEALKMMCSAKKGVIVNIASTSGIVGQEGQANYSASKAGIIAFSKVVAKEYARYGIRCNVVAPGFIETDMTNDAGGKSLKDKYMDFISLKRFGEPQDIADAVAFLASSRSKYITGKVLTVDGGLID